jgi:hypothetical protein
MYLIIVVVAEKSFAYELIVSITMMCRVMCLSFLTNDSSHLCIRNGFVISLVLILDNLVLCICEIHPV